MTKKIWQSRTVILAVIQGLLGVLIALEMTNPTLQLAGVIAFGKAIVDIFLRLQTFTEIE